MKNAVLYILAALLSVPLTALGIGMLFTPDIQFIGVLFTAMGVLLFYAMAPVFIARRKRQHEAYMKANPVQIKARTAPEEPEGVAMIWWVLSIFLVPFAFGVPILIIIAIVHVGRKNRAQMRKLAKPVD